MMKASRPFAMQVARRIRELRETRGFSIRELARRSGLPPESVSRSERGVTEITLTNLAKLCKGLMIELPDFFSIPNASRNPPTNRPETREIRRIMSLLTSLPTEKRARVLRALALLLQD
jgi:transcriptional regulator with XRE-family HTH domain